MADPEFTDTARSALLWVLWHHQGASSKVGQPLRFALGMGAHDRLSDSQVAEAMRWGELHAVAQPAAARDVLAERQRQITAEGWTPEHDDEHSDGEMARAASVYANPNIWDILGHGPVSWPWSPYWYKPTDRRRDLIKAGALILAEIERLDRAVAPSAVLPEA